MERLRRRGHWEKDEERGGSAREGNTPSVLLRVSLPFLIALLIALSSLFPRPPSLLP